MAKHREVCIVIPGPDDAAIRRQICAAKEQEADLVELCTDLFHPAACQNLSIYLKQAYPCRTIIRGCSLGLSCDWCDGPEGNLISYHNHTTTPIDLDALVHSLPLGPLRKIACMTHSTVDALRLIRCAQQHSSLLTVGMGPHGLVTRLMSRFWSYSALSPDETTAPGQPTLQTLRHYPCSSHLYGLIGGTVTQSPSHLTHQAVIRHYGLDAFYVKMVIQPDELAAFLSLAKEVGGMGFSVTAPLKEAIVPYLDELRTDLGAVNTLSIEEGHWIGYNTDGDGLLATLPAGVECVAILGGGGAARSCYGALKSAGYNAYIVSRRPTDFAPFIPLEELSRIPYDLLLQTIPHADLHLPVHSGARVMDLNLSPTPFLQKLREAGYWTQDGKPLFVAQAARQFSIWFGLPVEAVSTLLTSVMPDRWD